MADNTIGALNVAITGDYSELQPAIQAAAELARTSGDQIASAFGSQVTPALEQAGAAAGGAGEQFHQLHLNLEEMASLAGFTVGLEQAVELLKEFISDAIEAASQVQFLTVALTGLTGSMESANEIMEAAESISMRTTAGFLELAKAGQSFAAFGVAAEGIPAILEGVAEWAEVSGKSVEGLSAAIEGAAVSGQLRFRSLGLTASDLADVMGVSADKAKEAFKNLGDDVTTRMEIIAEAMHNKGEKGATDLQKTHEVALNALKTAWHEFAADLGEALLPTLDKALKGLGDTLVGVAGAWAFLTAFLKDGVNVVQGVTDGIKAYAEVAAKASEATQKFAIDHKALDEQIQKTVAASQAHAAALEAAKEKWKEYGPAVSAATAFVDAFDVEQLKLTDNLIKAEEQYTHAIELGQGISRAYGDVEKAAKALGLTQGQLNDVFAGLQSTSFALPLTLGQVGQSLHDLIGPILDAKDAEKQWEDESSNVGRNVADPVVAAVDQIIDKSQKLQDQFDIQLHAYADLAASSTASSAQLKIAWDQLKATADELGISIGQLTIDLENANAQMGNLPVLSDQARAAWERLHPAVITTTSEWQKAVEQVNRAIERDLSKALTDVIFQTGKVGDAFKKLGEDVVGIILDHIIATALKPLLKDLDDVILKLGTIFGGGGGGGGAGTALPGFAPGMAGSTGIGGAGGVGGAIGGAVGIAGAIGSVGSFVTGIIGDFQTAHQTDVLRSIEYNTRTTAMWIGPHGGSGVGDWTWQTAVNTMGVTEFVGGGGWFHDSVVQQLDTLTDIDVQLKNIVAGKIVGGGGGGGAIAGGVPSGGNVVVNFGPVNINGAGNPQQTVQQIANYLRRVSNKFGPP